MPSSAAVVWIRSPEDSRATSVSRSALTRSSVPAVLDAARDAGVELQQRHLHRDDAAEHDPDQPDPRAAAQQPVDQPVLGQRAQALEGAGRAAARAGRAERRRSGRGGRSGRTCGAGGAAAARGGGRGSAGRRCGWPSVLLLELAGGPQARGLRARVRGDLARAGRDRAAEDELGLRACGRSRRRAGRAGRCSPRVRSARKRLTRRSSSEWKEMPARRPSARRICQASGSAASSWASSSLTAIRIAWKVRLAGWPPAKRAGAGIAALIASTSSKVVSSGRRAHDRAGDPVGVALLAVLAQRAGEPAALPRVDDLARGQLLARGPSACPAGRRRRRRSRARACRPASRTSRGRGRRGRPATPSSARIRRPCSKSARMKRVGHGDLGGELGERLLGERVAVDRDQRARPGRAGRRRGARGRPRRACSRRRSGPAAGPAPR